MRKQKSSESKNIIASIEQRREEMHAENVKFAHDLCARLNALIVDWDQEIGRDIARLLEERVSTCVGTQEHPSLVCTDRNQIGTLGLLNGIIGGNLSNQPRIAMQVNADDSFRFTVQE
jgi:hypothetical protein